MKSISFWICTVLFLSFTAIASDSTADDATTQLFQLMNKGGCVPSSLTGKTWTISSPPVGTHGALNWGDEVVFEQLGDGDNFASKSSFNVWVNGALWANSSGWEGSCMRDSDQSAYVIYGEIELDGCMHELAIGRLDHDDGLGLRVEIVFQDKKNRKAEICVHGEGPEPRHPGHAHGNN